MLKNRRPSLNAATMAALAGAAIRISPLGSRIRDRSLRFFAQVLGPQSNPVTCPDQGKRRENFSAFAGRSPFLDQHPSKHRPIFGFSNLNGALQSFHEPRRAESVA